MRGLSRSQLRSRAILIVAVAAFIVIEVFCVFLFIVNRRISRELVDGRWREPTTILSAAGGEEREVARLYGVDWRANPPVSLSDLPPHVGQAFVAAEDVRFRRHLGMTPTRSCTPRNERSRG